MRRLPILWLALLTLPGIGRAAEPAAKNEPTAAEPSATTEKQPAAVVRTVTIDPNAPRPVCRRVVPTGSRIAEKRCETAERSNAAEEEASRASARRDFQALRDQQMLREQARQAAMAEALRRRGQ